MKRLLKKLTPPFLARLYHWLYALAGAMRYGFPSRSLKVIGVTGTNGKSTTVHLVAAILEKAGYTTASFSSVRFRVAGKESRNELKMTMPGRLMMQRLLREAVAAGCTHAVVEVTSEGIMQHRHAFINFGVAVLTNVRPEHIEAHGSFENYRAAKGKLFAATKGVHVLNADDENLEYFMQFPAREKHAYGMRQSATLTATDVVSTGYSSQFTVQKVAMQLPLPGAFNVSNALAAIGACRALGVPLEVARDALGDVRGVPGRMEAIQETPFRVVVDYAHTPDALENVYETLGADSKLVCVLGSAGGGRDTWKRPAMGKVAARFCNAIVLTNEDPYDEDPEAIIAAVRRGIEGEFPPVEVVLDRRKAIARAVALTNPGDTLIITGKGSEVWMVVANGVKIPWDDRQVVRDALKQ